MKALIFCFLTACSCAKQGTIPGPPLAAATPIECFVTSPTPPLGVSCTGANLGAEILPLNLQGMFVLTATQTIKGVGITNQNWGAKATPLLLQSCISVSVYDSATQSFVNHGLCGANVNLQTRSLE